MLSKRLKQLREEKGLLQKDIAEMLKITTSAYGFYEQGKRDPDTSVVNKLADFFDVTVDYLLGRSDIRNTSKVEFQTKAYHNLDTDGLSSEDIEYIDALIAGIKAKRKAEREAKKG